jgi:hypothetical protein
MKTLQRPVLTTVLFGLICGAASIPLSQTLNAIFFQPYALSLTLWLFSAGYALLVGYWSKNKIMPILYPLVVLLIAAFLVESAAAFFLLALAVISWIRSGIYFQEYRAAKFVVELLLCAAGGTLIAVFAPVSSIAWALSFWMFFLLQGLYFAVFDGKPSRPRPEYEKKIDAFERASSRAEDILSTGGIL